MASTAPAIQHGLRQVVRDAVDDALSTFSVPGAQVAWLVDGRIEQLETGVAPDARFRLASVTKVFTAALLMQLVADGELGLDEPIGQVLTARDIGGLDGEITAAQLLSHTSGLQNDHDQQEYGSTQAYVRALAGEPLLFRPGRHFSYANAGYVVAGRVIEALTGLPWEEAARSFLLDPLGIEAAFVQSEPVNGEVARGHVRRADGQIAAVAPVRTGRGWAPAAGLAMSAAGLLRLVRMHLEGGRTAPGHPLLPASAVRQMRRRRVLVADTGFAEGWGLGWALNRGWFGHDGEGAGSAVYVRANAELGLGLALVVGCVPARQEWRRLVRSLAGAGIDVGEAELPPLPAGPVLVDPEVAGVYESRAGSFEVAREGGELTLRAGRHGRFALTPVDPCRCLAVPEEGGDRFVVAFLRDDEGGVGYLQTGGRVARRIA